MPGILRNPQAQLLVNGQAIPCTSVDVHQSKTKKGDTFKASFPFEASAAVGMDENFWSTAPNLTAQVTINGSVVFTGVIDHSDYDFSERKLEVSGRDAGSALIDKTSSEKFQNQQPTDIVQKFASDAGLQTSIDTPGGLAGKQWQIDTAKITHRGSQWTVVNELAELFGMTAYMTGGTLYFKNYPEFLPTYPITYIPPTPQSYAQGTFVKLSTSRNHILGRPVTTNVRSRNHRDKKTYTATHTQSGSGTPLVYNHTVAGVSQSQAQTIADKKHAETVSHELELTALEFPGDETLTPLFEISLSGTGTAFDQTYEIKSVEHKVSFEGGFRTTVGCKNKSAKGGS